MSKKKKTGNPFWPYSPSETLEAARMYLSKAKIDGTLLYRRVPLNKLTKEELCKIIHIIKRRQDNG